MVVVVVIGFWWEGMLKVMVFREICNKECKFSNRMMVISSCKGNVWWVFVL